MKKVNILIFILPILLVFLVNIFYRSFIASGTTVLDVEFNKKEYCRGDLVVIKVYLMEKRFLWSKPLVGRDVGIQVDDSAGNIVYVDQSRTNADGCAVFSFRLSKFCRTGVYKVHVVIRGYYKVVEFNVKG